MFFCIIISNWATAHRTSGWSYLRLCSTSKMSRSCWQIKMHQASFSCKTNTIPDKQLRACPLESPKGSEHSKTLQPFRFPHTPLIVNLFLQSSIQVYISQVSLNSWLTSVSGILLNQKRIQSHTHPIPYWRRIAFVYKMHHWLAYNWCVCIAKAMKC